MKGLSLVAAVATLSPFAQGNAVTPVEVVPRALPDSPNGYTPSEVNCPNARPSVRSASTLSHNETSWLEKRRNNTITPMKSFLGRLNITDFDAQSYIQSHSKNASALPNIGIAVSGGGWRALLNGAGAIEAFDSRTPNATTAGHLGGLLQSSTYIAGLSGGSWLVGSIFMNNFSTVTALRDDTSGSVWEFGNSVVEDPAQGGIQILDTAQYYTTLVNEVDGKSHAGFHTSLTDIWGRALSFQLINSTNGGPAYTWSSIALSQGFENADIPFPVIIADERAPNQVLIPQNTTIYEFNPFEMGTWDRSIFGFVPTKYLGSNFTAGSIPANDKCTVGYDNSGFIMGTSSTLFNQLLLQVNSTSLPSIFKNALNSLLRDLEKLSPGFQGIKQFRGHFLQQLNNEDIADYSPNPFYHYNQDTNPSANNRTLTLVDGGEDNQNLPLHPLIQPVRGVDVIFAVDASADTNYNWPNGSSLVQTYERSAAKIANGTAFPNIPDTNTFINLGLNKRPTFFGCNASNITSAHPVPLVVYIPNAPYTGYSNVSTFQLSINDTQRDAIILNGYDVATMANGTADSSWPMCVGCAILSRSFHRTRTPVPAACTKCFNTFCWDGTRNSTKPAPYEPTLLLTKEAAPAAQGVQSSASKFGNWKRHAILSAASAMASAFVLLP